MLWVFSILVFMSIISFVYFYKTRKKNTAYKMLKLFCFLSGITFILCLSMYIVNDTVYCEGYNNYIDNYNSIETEIGQLNEYIVVSCKDENEISFCTDSLYETYRNMIEKKMSTKDEYVIYRIENIEKYFFSIEETQMDYYNYNFIMNIIFLKGVVTK